MTDAAWVVLAGLTLAALVPLFKWTVKAVAHEIVSEVAKQLNIDDLVEDVAYIKNEVTVNGGETVKDRVLGLQHQIGEMQRDLELLFGPD